LVRDWRYVSPGGVVLCGRRRIRRTFGNVTADEEQTALVIELDAIDLGVRSLDFGGSEVDAPSVSARRG
jgi:hypothetical protein